MKIYKGIHCDSFIDHGTHYNFYDSQELVSDFLTVFENVFIPRADLRQVRFKCTFTVVNGQPASRAGFAEITDSRVWQTNVHDSVYFNDFIKSNLSQDILKRIIINGMAGSSWRFKRFDRICLAVNIDEIGSVGK